MRRINRINKISVITLCVLILINILMLCPVWNSAAVDTIVSQGKTATLVDQTGDEIPQSDIAADGSKLLDGNKSSYARTKTLTFGAIVDLQKNFTVSQIEFTNFSMNYVTKYDIKGSVNGTSWTLLLKDQVIGKSETKSLSLSESFTGRYIWISPTAFTGTSNYTMAEIAVYGQEVAAKNNISLNKNATLVDSTGAAVTASDISFPAANLVDGVLDNYAQTKNTLFGALIDLGSKAKITEVAVTSFHSNYLTGYNIKGSLDGNTYTLLKSNITIGQSETKSIVLDTAYTGRYIWIESVSFTADQWRCLSEVTVYGEMLPPDEYLISLNKPCKLVDENGAEIPGSLIYAPASNLVDGNSTNYAQTPSTLFGAVVDIGEITQIANVEVTNLFTNYVTKYNIKVSKNGTDWDLIAENLSLAASQTKAFRPESKITARYIWIVPLSFSTTSWYCLSEISVYTNDYVPLTGVALVSDTVDLPLGFTYNPKILFTPENATLKSVRWTSSDENVAKVNADGSVTAAGSGTATVTGITDDGHLPLSYTVRAYEAVNAAIYKKDVWMDTDAGYGNIASFAVDGSFVSYAQSALNLPWKLTVSLPVAVDISSFRITMNDNNYADHYKIYISDDITKSNPWTLVYERSSAVPATTVNILDHSVSAKFVMLEAVSTVGSYGYAINEFEIFTAYGYDTAKIPKPDLLHTGPKNFDSTVPIVTEKRIDYKIIPTYQNRYQSAHAPVALVNVEDILLRLNNLLFENYGLPEENKTIENPPETPVIEDTGNTEEIPGKITQKTIKRTKKILVSDDFSMVTILWIVLSVIIVLNAVLAAVTFIIPRLKTGRNAGGK